MRAMNTHLKLGFAGLVLTQTAHSTEEYITRLWEVWPPARYASGLFSSDLETGFLIINIGLNLIGYLCLFLLIMPERRGAFVALRFWIGLETLNGVFHLSWAASQGGYTSGSLTAPIFLILVIYLGLNLKRPVP